MTVVIVDDDAQMRKSLRRFVEDLGLQVLGEAVDGSEALEVVERVNPQIVLLDGRMPTADGLITTQRLRARHPHIQVIAHTSDPEMAKQMTLLGAVAAVVKGAPPDELRGLLLSLKDRSQQRPRWPPLTRKPM